MSIEIRPIVREEAVRYLRVLPFANGLPNWEPAPAAWYGGAAAWPPPNPPASTSQLESWVDDLMAESFHPVAAFVDGALVGGSAMVSLGITVPGSATVALGGVTATGVLATHRRRGLLRAMMQAMFDGARERGEPIAALSASEGGIYGRFGFAPATWRVRWELDRADAALLDAPAPPGSLELVDAATAQGHWPQVHEQVRAHRVGELTPQPDQWSGLHDEPAGTDGPLRYLVHRDPTGAVDGIAHFRLPWSPDVAGAGVLVVEAVEATNPSAYRALWSLLTDFDLTRRVVAASRPVDEPLRWMLRNPRALRITRHSDNLWLRILDLSAALTARRYRGEVDVTFTVGSDPMCPQNVGTWHLSADTGGAHCERVGAAADLELSIEALGSLYLGGMSAQVLAAAGRITAHRADALEALGAALRTDPEPFNSFGF